MEKDEVGSRHPGGTVPVLWREVAGRARRWRAALGDPETTMEYRLRLCGNAIGPNVGKVETINDGDGSVANFLARFRVAGRGEVAACGLADKRGHP